MAPNFDINTSHNASQIERSSLIDSKSTSKCGVYDYSDVSQNNFDIENIENSSHYSYIWYRFNMTNHTGMCEVNCFTDDKHTFTEKCLVDNKKLHHIGEDDNS